MNMRSFASLSLFAVTLSAASVCFAQVPPAAAPAPNTPTAAETPGAGAPPQAPAPAETSGSPAPFPAGGEPVAAALAVTNAEIYRASKERAEKQIDELLEVPETPAAFSLGLSADVVARPTTLREAAGSLKTIIGPDGKLIPGAAIEVAPFYGPFTRKMTAEEWRDNTFYRLLASFRLSVATASDPKAADPDNAATLLALGARIGDDRTDPRFHQDAVKAIKGELAKCAPPADVNPFGNGAVAGQPASVQQPCEFEKVEKEIVDDLSGLRWEVAGTSIYADRKVNDTDANFRGWQAWAAGEYRFSSSSGLGLGLDYRLTEVPGANPKAFRVGARYNRESNHFTLSVAGAYANRTAVSSTDDTAKDNWFDAGATLSAKLSDANSLSLGAQWQKNLDTKQSDLIIVFAVTTSSGESLFQKYMKP